MMAFLVLLQRDLRSLYGQWPTLIVFYVGLPVLLIVVTANAFRPLFEHPELLGLQPGDVPPTVWDQVVPGFTLLLALGSALTLATRITAERARGLWRTLAVAPLPAIASPLLSNALAVWLLTVLQALAVMGVGWLLGMSRDVGTVVLTVMLFETVAVGLGLFTASLIPDPSRQAAVVNPMQALIFASPLVGGAVVPLFTLPLWLRVAARATPHYWAMDAVQGGPLILDWLVLAAMAGLLGGAGLRRFAGRGMV